MSRTRAPSSPPASANKRPLFRVPPEVEAELIVSEEDVAAGRLVELTSEELAAWEATGELPAAVEHSTRRRFRSMTPERDAKREIASQGYGPSPSI